MKSYDLELAHVGSVIKLDTDYLNTKKISKKLITMGIKGPKGRLVLFKSEGLESLDRQVEVIKTFMNFQREGLSGED